MMDVDLRRSPRVAAAALALGLALIASLALPASSIGAPGQSVDTWTQEAPATSPTARSYAAMAYFPPSAREVLFGGGHDETWTYDGSDWTLTSPTASPPRVEGASMAYDPATEEIVLFGGFAYNAPRTGTAPSNETWTYNGTTWTQQSPSTSPPAYESAAMAYDPATEEIVLFGGFGAGVDHNETWTYDGTEWTQSSPARSPSARERFGMAYDPAIGEVVLFGGYNRESGTDGDTWTYDGTDWTQRSPATSPSNRLGASMAYDSAAGEVVLFGGFSPFSPGNETWTYNGTTWTQRSPVVSAPQNRDAAMDYDPATEAVVLFGGTSDASMSDRDETWTYRLSFAPPTAAIAAPAGGQAFTVGQSVGTVFSCADAPGGPGIEACTDSGGAASGAGRLDTATPGPHTYTVTARSVDGEEATSTLSYLVTDAVVPVGPVIPKGPAPSTPVAPSPHCTVPKLKGKSLGAAKRTIRAAGCRVGSPKERDGATAADGKIVAQSPRPGVAVPAGTMVEVTLLPISRRGPG